jgi:hypothetical protein
MDFAVAITAERYPVARVKFCSLQIALSAYVVRGEFAARVTVDASVIITLANELTPPTETAILWQPVAQRLAEARQSFFGSTDGGALSLHTSFLQ